MATEAIATAPAAEVKEKKKGVNFFVGFLMTVLYIITAFVVFGVAVFDFLDMDFSASTALISGIVVSALYAILILGIPYFRRSSYMRYLMYLAAGDAIWWMYCLVTD